MRIFEHKRIWNLNQTRYKQALDLLVRNVRSLDSLAVIGIARGGSKLGCDLAEVLNQRYYEVRAKHNNSDELYSATKLTVEVDLDSVRKVGNEGIYLLVDDICGTGSTIIDVANILMIEKDVKKIYTLTLCRNVGSNIIPDYYVWPVSDWVIFPWESYQDDRIAEILPKPTRVFKKN